MTQNELTVWTNEALPVISMGNNREFDRWLDGAPVLTMDESESGLVGQPIRRRVAMF